MQILSTIKTTDEQTHAHLWMKNVNLTHVKFSLIIKLDEC
jgi:hypothetical protein